MSNAAIQATNRAAERYSLASIKLFFAGMLTPRWWRNQGEGAKAEANENVATVRDFNAKLEDCHACIAPEVPADFNEVEQIAAAIIHFEGLAEECRDYAQALRTIMSENFGHLPK